MGIRPYGAVIWAWQYARAIFLFSFANFITKKLLTSRMNSHLLVVWLLSMLGGLHAPHLASCLPFEMVSLLVMYSFDAVRKTPDRF